MKILQVVPHYFPAVRFGGPQDVAHQTGRALVRAGHQVTVCTTNLEDEDSDLDVPLDELVDVDGVQVYYEPVVLSRYWGLSPRLWSRVRKEVSRADVVLVHAHYQFANWAGARLARIARKPYVVYAHSSLHRQGLSHKRNGLVKRAYLRILEHRNLTEALFIAFNAVEERDYSLYREFGFVLPNGIDPAALDDSAESGRFRRRYAQLATKTLFLFLGRLDVEHKGLDLLVPAFARVAREHPNAHLALVGSDEAAGADRIRRLARAHGVEQDITMTGLLKGPDKVAALRDADAFVLPSRFEGLSIALLEALYCGIPLLVTDQVGLHREVQRTGAGIVVRPDTESICSGLMALSDPDRRAGMRGRAISLIRERYTWDVITRDLVDLLSDHIKQPASQA